MISKLKRWLAIRKENKMYRQRFDAGMPLPFMYTQKQLEEHGSIRYNDGKRDGLAIAREQATKSLKEILWQQNNQSRIK